MVEIEAGGTVLRLMPQRAAFLTTLRWLLVADAHLGKAASFRRLGVPVPEATTQGTLDRLSQAIEQCDPVQVVFLGDLLHSAHAHAEGTVAAVGRWRARHSGLGLTLVRGNHDDRAGDPPADWGVHCVDGPLLVEGLALTHHPEPLEGRYVLAGHVHPAAVIGGRGPGALRLPCFHLGARVGVLPAFGEFTGSRVLPCAPGDRVFVIGGDAVRELPAAPALHCA